MGAAAAIMIVCDDKAGRGGRRGNRGAASMAGRLRGMAALVAGCFPRRETRQTFRDMTEAMLMGVARANCQPLAEALGHGGPHRL